MWEKGCYNKNRMQCKSSRFAYFLRRNCVNSFQELVQSIDWGSLTDALLRVLGVFLCLTVHETCHGLAAYALGDPTAKREHRLSLNPLHHIDWFGLAAMLLVGFGCNVPAIMATRTVSSDRDRKMTILLTPFMSCSAKIPIYTLFAAAFFPGHELLVMLALYFGGILVGILVALVLKNTAFKGNPVPFVMELPNYRFPSAKSVVLLMWLRQSSS